MKINAKLALAAQRNIRNGYINYLYMSGNLKFGIVYLLRLTTRSRHLFIKSKHKAWINFLEFC